MLRRAVASRNNNNIAALPTKSLLHLLRTTSNPRRRFLVSAIPSTTTTTTTTTTDVIRDWGSDDVTEVPMDPFGHLFQNPIRRCLQDHCAAAMLNSIQQQRQQQQPPLKFSQFWIAKQFATACAASATKKGPRGRPVFSQLLGANQLLTAPEYEVIVPLVDGGGGGGGGLNQLSAVLLNMNHPLLQSPHNVDLRSMVRYCNISSSSSSSSSHRGGGLEEGNHHSKTPNKVYTLVGGGVLRSVQAELEHLAHQRNFISQCWATMEEVEHLGWELLPSATPYRSTTSAPFRSSHITTKDHESVRSRFEKRHTFVNTEDIATEIDFTEYFTFDHRMYDVIHGFTIPALQVVAFREHLRQIGLLRGCGREPSPELSERCLVATVAARASSSASNAFIAQQKDHLGAVVGEMPQRSCWQWSDLWRFAGTEAAIKYLFHKDANHNNGSGTPMEPISILPDALPFVPQSNGTRAEGGTEGLFVAAQTNDPVSMMIKGRELVANGRSRGSGTFIQRRFGARDNVLENGGTQPAPLKFRK